MYPRLSGHSSMDEIHTVAQSSDEVDESKSALLHRFRLMSGEDAGTFRSKPKMDRSIPRISTHQLHNFQESSGIQRIVWN